MSRDEKKNAMHRVRQVEGILREWNPIECNVPANEYDSYAPHIVSLVAQDCTVGQLSAHLHEVRTVTMGLPAEPENDASIAKKIIGSVGNGDDAAFQGGGALDRPIPGRAAQARRSPLRDRHAP